jgi:hypothetical protein
MTEIYIENQKLDQTEDISTPLNFAIADISQPEKRNSSFSKTIVIPGSKNNNLIFTHIYDITKESISTDSTINFTPDYNPNLKASCKILRDGLEIFQGYAQLLQINILNSEITYEVAVFGSVSNIFSTIEGMLLTDLDFSEYNHDLTRANQLSSWSTGIKKNGLDYGNFSGGLPIGEGYVYPIIDYGYSTSEFAYTVIQLFPAIYLKNYIDKIFTGAGYSYTSDFFNSAFFKKLIIPFTGEIVPLSDIEVESRKFRAGGTPGFINYPIVYDGRYWGGRYSPYSFNSLIVYPDDSIGVNFDNDNVYSHVTGVYTVNKAGIYNLYASLPSVTLAISNYPGSADGIRYISLVIVFEMLNNTTGERLGYSEVTIGNGGDPTGMAFEITNGTGKYLNQNDEIVTRIRFSNYVAVFTLGGVEYTPPVADRTAAGTIGFGSACSFYNTPLNTTLIEGEEVLLSSYIPLGVTCKDLLLAVIRKFNLYVDVDSDNPTNLIIEPAKDFYEGNSTVDWTKKLDISKEINIKPLSELEGKQYIFRYKADKDFYNTNYQGKYTRTYGSREININNDFLKGQKVVESIFSPTPSVGNFHNNMTIPRFVKKNPDNTSAPLPVNIRLLIYGGEKNVEGSWNYSGVTETTYSYAGHLDDPFNPTIDLLYDLPKELYYGDETNIGSNYTDNNVYNIYWKQFIDEITDKDSKLVTAYFHLTPLDIYNLNFRNFIYVDGSNFRLNKVIDYDPTKEVCQVELSKIKLSNPFVPSTVIIAPPPIPSVPVGIIEGSLNEVQSLFMTNLDNTVEGGLNEVRRIGAGGTIFIING